MHTEPTESPAETALNNFRKEVMELSVEQRDLVDIERRLQKLLNARGCEEMAEVMKAADSDAQEVEIDGERWGNRRVARGEYQTVFGLVELERSVYQHKGRGRVAVPMDLRLGIVEGSYTPRMARILCLATAFMTDEEAARLLAEVGTAAVSKSTIHRVPRSIAARYETRRKVIERAVRDQDPIPEAAVTIQVGLDGVMVPQDGEHAKPRGRKADLPDPPRHELRYGALAVGCPAEQNGQTGRAWHEGAVGTVAFFDCEGRRLKTTYVARMPEPHKATLVASLEEEMQAVVQERPNINIAFASDGAPQQWAALDAMASRLPPSHTGHTMNLVDAFHVAEYVKKAANSVAGHDTAEAKVMAATWRETIKETDGGAKTVLRSMRARLAVVGQASNRTDLEQAIGYIAKQNEEGRTNYAEALRRNYPIGTGITEAAGKTIVSTRMKRAGARFDQHGGQTVMLFRAAEASGRFEALHRELGATYTKPVQLAA